LARFLPRNQLPGENEKNASAGPQLQLLVAKLRIPSALRSLDRAFFSFSPASGTNGAQKRAKAHIPGPLQDHARVSFIVSAFPACALARLIHPGRGTIHRAPPLAAGVADTAVPYP